MIYKVQRKRGAKDHPKEQRSIRELPVCSLHGSKSIAAGHECKAKFLPEDLPILIDVCPEVILTPDVQPERAGSPWGSAVRSTDYRVLH